MISLENAPTNTCCNRRARYIIEYQYQRHVQGAGRRYGDIVTLVSLLILNPVDRYIDTYSIIIKQYINIMYV